MAPYALPAEIWIAGLVFIRVGAIVMLLPGIGETFVPPRIRLSFALVLSLCITPIAAATLPPLPATVGAMAGIALKELFIGLLVGGLLRMLLAALSVTGEVVSLQTTLAFAQTANPSQAQPGAALTAFLTMLGIVLIFATGLHRMFIGAIANSYALFEPAERLMVGDAALVAIQALAKAFSLGVQLAAPVIVFSLIFNIATGLVGRVMPQFQVFFAATPLNILLGLSIFALSLGLVGLVWISQYTAFVGMLT
jgi:flagellar biosynthetic protein FliR